MVKSRCRNRLVAWTLIFGLGLYLTAIHQRYIRNFLYGPFAEDSQSLSSIRNVDDCPHYFVTVHGDKFIDSGIREITITNTRNGYETGRKVSANYYLMFMGERLLIFKTPHAPSVDVSGVLTPADPSLVDKFSRTGPDFDQRTDPVIRERLYPFMIDDTSFRQGGYFAILGWLIFGVLFVIYAGRDWKFLSNPDTHPVIKRQSAWGDRDAVATEAQQDFLTPALKTFSGWRFGNKFVIHESPLDFKIFRFSDLLWAYKKVTKKRINFVPVGSDHCAEFFFWDLAAGQASVAAKEAEIDMILRFAFQRAPSAIFGYTDEAREAFKARLLAIAEQRQRSSPV